MKPRENPLGVIALRDMTRTVGIASNVSPGVATRQILVGDFNAVSKKGYDPECWASCLLSTGYTLQVVGAEAVSATSWDWE